MRNKMKNEIVKCEFAGCENEATTNAYFQPKSYPNPNGVGTIVPNKIIINSCSPCELWSDIRLYGSD
jgi:hypothetical protein